MCGDAVCRGAGVAGLTPAPCCPKLYIGVRSSPSKCVFHTYLTKDCWGPLGTAGDGWGRLGTAGDGWRCWGPLGIVICNGIYIW